MANRSNNEERRTMRAADECSRRRKIEPVSQIRFDRGLINLRTLEQDLMKERLVLPSPLKENIFYNHEIRETILHWMLTVCHCNKISIDTYALSIRLFDMFMEEFSRKVDQNLYQLVAGSVLMMASKLLDASTLSMKTIIDFVGKGYSSQDFIDMEGMLLGSIRQDLCSTKQLYGVTPVDMIPIIAFYSSERRHFEALRCKATLMYGLLAHTRVFFGALPSLVAGALVYRASLNLGLVDEATKTRDQIIQLIKTKKENLEYIMDKIERAFIEWMKTVKDLPLMLPTFDLSAMPCENTPTDILTSSKVINFLF